MRTALRRVQIFAGILSGVSIEHQESKEAAGRADRSRNGRGRQTLARQAGNPSTQICSFKPFDPLAAFLGPALQFCEVAPVTLTRVDRETLFNLNISKKF